MRMRRKKYLDERVQNVNDMIIVIEGEEFFKKSEEEKFNLIDLKGVFGNDNPVHLEIGCGKGAFAINMAKLHPEINFLAVEKLTNVIIAGAESLSKEGLDNVRFLNLSAQNLLYYLKERSIEKIYLNFSCPYPKNTYANHRLTSPRFLALYKKLLQDNGTVSQKTDNDNFFEYSIECFNNNGYTIDFMTTDLHAHKEIPNVMTEYEEKFVKLNKNINYLLAHPNKE